MTASHPQTFITLTSDFGIDSQGVGAMKAVIHQFAPGTPTIDITHGVTPFSITEGACEMEALAHLPPGGIHVCVVDPGVGSGRVVVAIRTKRGDYLVGPDNGVLRHAATAMGGIDACHVVENPQFVLADVSSTFHGRDVMAPSAAAIAAGVELQALGPSIGADQLVPAPYGEADLATDPVVATVIHTNRYGTAYLNILNADHGRSPVAASSTVRIASGARSIEAANCATFSDVALGEPLMFPGHFGRMQLAVNQGSFVDLLAIGLGDEVSISI